MKRRFLFPGMAAALTFGLALAGCGFSFVGDGGGSGGTDSSRSITVMGIPAAHDGKEAIISIYAGVPTAEGSIESAAFGIGKVSGGTVTAALKTPAGANWTGSGGHLISLIIGNREWAGFYTGGADMSEKEADVTTYDIAAKESVIPFDKFKASESDVPPGAKPPA